MARKRRKFVVGKARVQLVEIASVGRCVEVFDHRDDDYFIRLVEKGLSLADCGIHETLTERFDEDTADKIIAMAIMRGAPP